jgi:predicted RNA binding protein YcfA (HicA-like mRNA interferase family)
VGSLPKATKRKDFIKRCKALGWTGPHEGVGPHPKYMERNGRVLKVPNAHSKRSDIGEGLLKVLLEEGGMTADEWLGKGGP